MKLEGYLEKRGHGWTAWRQRYFVMNGAEVDYYKEKPPGPMGVPQGTIVLTPTSVVIQADRQFTLSGVKDGREYVIRAESAVKAYKWAGAIQAVVALLAHHV